jgi:hypothetical protein
MTSTPSAPSAPSGPPLEQFLAAADAVADARADVDRQMAREVFGEAAVLLHDGLALDGLDEHDRASVVAGLCADLAAEDPGAAVRAHAASAAHDDDLHDPTAVAGAYASAVGVLQL